MQKFSQLAIAAVAAIGVGIGGYQFYQEQRASGLEAQASSIYAKVKGAKEIAERERSILAERSQKAKEALGALSGFEEQLDLLANRPASELAGMVAAAEKRSSGFIERAVELERALAPVAAGRQGQGNAAFIEAASSALAQQRAFESDGAGKSFSGAPGFASQSLEAAAANVASTKALALEREAKLREAVAAGASDFGAPEAALVLDSRSREALKVAMAATGAAAEKQIEEMKDQVRRSAAAAFEREGESMGSSDWDEIRSDLERDRGWIDAKAQLRAAAKQSAVASVEESMDSWESEAEHALALAHAVSLDPSMAGHLSPWELAMLYSWMSPTQPEGVLATGAPKPKLPSYSAVVPRSAMELASRGYSLSHRGRALDPLYNVQQPQGASKSPQASAPPVQYKPSIHAMEVAKAVETAKGATPARLAQLDAKAAASRSAMEAAMRAAGQSAPAIMAKGSAEPRKSAPLADLPSTRYAGLDKISEISKASAQKAALDAAQAASIRAAQLQSVKAAQAAAKGAADKAAQAAAQAAANKAAQAAAQAAANKAAQAAAQAAANKAAQAAAQAAANKAAQAAAQSAANKAAQAAAQSAANKAAQSASTRSASMSSGRR